MPLHVHLIHHGETEWTFSSRHTGRTNIPLTVLGEDEVRERDRRLCGMPFDHVLTSPLIRAQRTCELAGLAKDAEIEPDLQEWDCGDYEGRRSVETSNERPGWNVFRDGCPQGETPQQNSARADRLIARLSTMDGNVALFSHGQSGSAIWNARC